MKTPIKKIVWALDTMEPAEFQQNARFIIGALTRETAAEVYPVHVLNFPYASAGDKTNYEEAYLALAEKRLRKLPEESDIPQIQGGQVLIERTGLLRNSVELVLDYALSKDADAIVVSTHSRGSVTRLFMGSFAETLLLQSDIPVITVNPKTQVRERISNVLFPTNFNKQFRAGFQQTLQLCSTLGANLTVFYKEPFIPMMEVSGELFRALEEEAEERKREAGIWREWARSLGVSLEVRMDSMPGNVADEIESYAAKHNFDLIVMISGTTDLDAPRVGSTCRRIVRGAHCPVWTMRTDDYDELDFD